MKKILRLEVTKSMREGCWIISIFIGGFRLAMWFYDPIKGKFV